MLFIKEKKKKKCVTTNNNTKSVDLHDSRASPSEMLYYCECIII